MEVVLIPDMSVAPTVNHEPDEPDKQRVVARTGWEYAF